MSLPAGYAIRGATLSDAPAVAATLLADDLGDALVSVYDEDFVRDQWSAPGLDPARDAWIVLDPSGAVVGSATLMPDGERVVGSWGVVEPEHRGLGIGSTLLDRVEARVADRLRGVAGATIRHSINDVDEPARRMLDQRGFRFVRSFRHMQIDLDGPVDPSEAPTGIRIRGIDPDVDLARAHAVFVEGFRDHWGYRVIAFDEWLAGEVDVEGYDPTLWLLATDGDEAVGALNAIVRGDRGWVGELAVREPWRGRGVATALLRRAFATFAERGLRSVLLNVDFDNPTGAMALYEKVGMRAVRGYDVYEKPLPG